MRDCSQIKRFDKLNLMIFNNKTVSQKTRLARPLMTTSVMASRWRCGLAMLAPLILAITPLGAAAVLFDDSFVIEKNQFNYGYCNISSARLELDVTESFGEPVIANRFEWEAGPNTPEDCLPEQMDLWVELRTQEGGQAFMPVAVNTATSGLLSQELLASPGWEGFICQTRSFPARCYGEDSARSLIENAAPPDRFFLATLTTGGDASTQIEPQNGSTPTKVARIDLGQQFESRLNASLDTLLSDEIKTDGRTSTEGFADSSAGVEGLVNLINTELSTYQRTSSLCDGGVTATYTATRLHECGLALQSEFELSGCSTEQSNVNRRERVEFEFADRPIESMDRMSNNNFATLSLALSEPQVISSDSAVNVFVLSARPSQAGALETVEKSIGTLQSLCALGRP